MIPRELERLIWQGKAIYQTWTIGTGSAGLLVPKNKAVIIFGFDSYPFIDAGTTDLSGLSDADWRARTNKVITIQNKSVRYNFLQRMSYLPTQGVLMFPTHFECYCPFTTDLTLTIANAPNVDDWTTVTAAAPAPSEGRPTPLGYGTTANKNVTSTQNIRFNNPASTEVRPYKDQKAFPGDNSYADFEVGIDADTKIIDPVGDATNIGNQQYPFITVHYVQVDEKLVELFR